MDDRSIINLYLKRDESAVEETAKSYGAMLRRFAADPTRFGAVNLMVRRAFAKARELRFAEGFRYYEDYHFILLALSAAERSSSSERRRAPDMRASSRRSP